MGISKQINILKLDKNEQGQSSSRKKEIATASLVNIDYLDDCALRVLRGFGVTDIYFYSSKPKEASVSASLSEFFDFQENFLKNHKIKGLNILRPSFPVNIPVNFYINLWNNADKMNMVNKLREQAALYALQPLPQENRFTKEHKCLITWLKNFSKLCETLNNQLFPKKWLQQQAIFSDITQLENFTQPLTETTLMSLMTLIFYLQDINADVLIIIDSNPEFLNLVNHLQQAVNNNKDDAPTRTGKNTFIDTLKTVLIPLVIENKHEKDNEQETIATGIINNKLDLHQAKEQIYITQLEKGDHSKFKQQIANEKNAKEILDILLNYISAQIPNIWHKKWTPRKFAIQFSSSKNSCSPAMAMILEKITAAGNSLDYIQALNEIIVLGKWYANSGILQSQMEKDLFTIFTETNEKILKAILELKDSQSALISASL